ncbi:MAG: hypothetical protein AAF656_11595, partial [Planctomycetota bacterium]
MRHLAAIAVLLFATVATAEPRRSGNIIYDLPAGWETRDEDGVFHNARPEDWLDLDDYSDVYIVPGESIDGGRAELEAWAFKRIEAVIHDHDDDDQLEWQQWQAIDDPELEKLGITDGSLGMGVVRSRGGRFDFAVAGYTFVVNGRAEAVYVEFEEMETARPAVADLLRIIKSFRFVNAGADPLEGKPKPGPLSG